MITKSQLNISVIKILVCSLLIGGMVSCESKDPRFRPAATERDHKNTQQETVSTGSVSLFLQEAAQFELDEIRLAILAQQNCGNNEVKELGIMMETAHKRFLRELQAIAGSRALLLPTTGSQEGTEFFLKLSSIRGKEFDRLYCEKIVAEHQNTILTFKNAQTTIEDPALEIWIGKTLRELRNHLISAMICEENCKRMRT